MLWDKHYPNYKKLYHGVDISPEVLEELRQSDRKMKYMEYDLKVEASLKDANGNISGFSQSREDSYERLVEVDKQFTSEAYLPDVIYEKKEEMQELHHSLELLDAEEQALIKALFFEGLTEREYGKKIGKAQKTVNKRKAKALIKIKNILESKRKF